MVAQQSGISSEAPSIENFESQWYRGEEYSPTLVAGEYYLRYRGCNVTINGASNKVTLPVCARAFGCSTRSIQRAIRAHEAGVVIKTKSAACHWRKMKPCEEDLLARYIKGVTEREGTWISWRVVTSMATLIQPGIDFTWKWFTGFCKRNSLQLKYGRVKPIDPRRLYAENKQNIRDWFEKTREAISSVPADALYNVDETGFNMFQQNGTTHVGSKDIDPRTIDRGKSMHITCVECISADGVQVSPMIIVANRRWDFLRKLKSEAMKNDRSTKDWAFVSTESGYADAAIFRQWIEHFDRLTRNGSEARPRVLLLDGCKAHFSAEISKYAEENNIKMIALPPNMAHLMQPLDVCYFGPQKKNLCKLMAQFARETGLQAPHFLHSLDNLRKSHANMGRLMGQSAFRKCGLFPIDPEMILNQIESDMPSLVAWYESQEELAKAHDETPLENEEDLENSETTSSPGNENENLDDNSYPLEETAEEEEGTSNINETTEENNDATNCRIIDRQTPELQEDASTFSNNPPFDRQDLEIDTTKPPQKRRFEQDLNYHARLDTWKTELLDNFNTSQSRVLKDLLAMQTSLLCRVDEASALLDRSLETNDRQSLIRARELTGIIYAEISTMLNTLVRADTLRNIFIEAAHKGTGS